MLGTVLCQQNNTKPSCEHQASLWQNRVASCQALHFTFIKHCWFVLYNMEGIEVVRRKVPRHASLAGRADFLWVLFFWEESWHESSRLPPGSAVTIELPITNTGGNQHGILAPRVWNIPDGKHQCQDQHGGLPLSTVFNRIRTMCT